MSVLTGRFSSLSKKIIQCTGSLASLEIPNMHCKKAVTMVHVTVTAAVYFLMKDVLHYNPFTEVHPVLIICLCDLLQRLQLQS